jgi:two-component system CheB/CheR fusion protein
VQHAIERALDDSPLAQLVVSAEGTLVATSPKARELLGLPAAAEGLPFAAVVREFHATELADFVSAATVDPPVITFTDQPWRPSPGESCLLNGGVVAIRDEEGALLGVTVTLEVSAASDELSRHNDELKRDVTELRSINDELRQRTDELNLVAIFLESVLTSLRGAVLVVDSALTVRVWNPQAERLWGIRRRDAMGSPLHSLDLRIPFDELRPSIERALAGDLDCAEAGVAVPQADGSVAAYTVSATPLLGPGSTVHGATLLFVERAS